MLKNQPYRVFSFIDDLLIAAQTADVGIKPNFAGGEVVSVESGKIVLQDKRRSD